MTYQVTYTNDYNTTQNAETIAARDYTEAYLLFTYKHPKQSIILEITEDLKREKI